MTVTKTKKWLVILLCMKLALSLWLVSLYFSSAHQERERVLQEQVRIQAEAVRKAARISEDLWHRANNAYTLDEWDALSKINLFDMAEQDQEQFRTMVQSKLFEMLFWQAETIMAHARGLLEQDQNSPAAGSYLEQARQTYERIEGLMPDLSEIAGNPQWNMRLYYLKGIYYFRSLIFIKKMQEEQSKVKDAMAQSVASFDKALLYAPKDRDTEVAIELLQTKAKNALSSSGLDAGKMELQLLPAKDREVGPFQTGPRTEGRH